MRLGEWRCVAKIPASAEGFDDLLAHLADRGIAVEKAEVPAPGYLD